MDIRRFNRTIRFLSFEIWCVLYALSRTI